jgi:hypothetical protein
VVAPLNPDERTCFLSAELLQIASRKGSVAVKTRFHIGSNFLSAIILATICAASEAQVLSLASPDAVVGAPPDSYRPALTGQGGPVAWQVLLVHNRGALAEMSRVNLDNRFPRGYRFRR